MRPVLQTFMKPHSPYLSVLVCFNTTSTFKPLLHLSVYSRLLYPSDADLYPHTGLCSHGISCISSLSLCKYPIRFLNPLSMLFLQIFKKMLGTKQLLLTTNLHSRKKNTMEINGYQQLFGNKHSLKYILCWTMKNFHFGVKLEPDAFWEITFLFTCYTFFT